MRSLTWFRRLHPRDLMTSQRPCLQTLSQRELGFNIWGVDTNIQTRIDDDSFGSDSSVNGYDPVTYVEAWCSVVTPRSRFCRGPDTLIPFFRAKT